MRCHSRESGNPVLRSIAGGLLNRPLSRAMIRLCDAIRTDSAVGDSACFKGFTGITCRVCERFSPYGGDSPPATDNILSTKYDYYGSIIFYQMLLCMPRGEEPIGKWKIFLCRNRARISKNSLLFSLLSGNLAPVCSRERQYQVRRIG